MHFRETITAITEFIFCEDEPGPVDLALVLGSPSISNVEPAIALYRAGLTPKILISGHGPTKAGPAEWRVYRDRALADGVAERDILIESEAQNTRENFLFSERIIANELTWAGISSLAICCKPIHSRRAFMTARHYFPKFVRLVMLPPRHPADIQADNWWTMERGRERVLGEISRIAEYGQKEDISLE
ncbi:YdcF family protein [Synechococcus sp. CBW1006]|nr:YdcF family protein [Synechococcus sp. CBW1006]